MSDLMVLSGLIAALAAFVGAGAAWRTAKAARDAVRMQILLDFSKRDADPEMGRATKRLWEFAREGSLGDDIRSRFDSLKKEDVERWHKIDDSRRIVHKFYIQLMQAKQAGLFSDREIIIGVYKHQLETVLQVLKPLEGAKEGKDYTRPIFKEYQRLYNEYDKLFNKYLRDRPG